MELQPKEHEVANITADQLRSYLASTHESRFVLLDVRQPEEYETSHIPGARLMSVGSLERRHAELEDLSGRHLIFYCLAGSRSERASGYAAHILGLPNVFNLMGGIRGWNGQKIPEFPRFWIIDHKAPVEDVLLQAMNLEKGAQRMYQAMAALFATSSEEQTIATLGSAEIAHARSLHGYLRETSSRPVEDFEKLYEGLEGNIIEGGQPIHQVLAEAHGLASHGLDAVLELALRLEYRAYDLYRSVADNCRRPRLAHALLELAEQEKRHAEALVQALGRVAA